MTPTISCSKNGLIGELRAIRREMRTALGLPAICRRLYGKGVAFVHVPKCAGRSVERGLRKTFKLSRAHAHAGVSFEQMSARFGQPIIDQDQRLDVLQNASDQRAAVYAYHLATGVKCVTGHAPVNAELLKIYGQDRAFVTVLRDPVERFISHFRYSYQAEGQGRIDLELEDFLKTDRARVFGSMYAKYFAHQTNEPNQQEIKDCLEKFAVVGFVDQMPKFETDVRAALNKRVSFGHTNATSKRRKPKPAPIEQDQKSAIEEICAPDIEIYRWAQNRFT